MRHRGQRCRRMLPSVDGFVSVSTSYCSENLRGQSLQACLSAPCIGYPPKRSSITGAAFKFFLQLFRRRTRHPAIMSCRACFFSVNPAMMYPINAGTMLVMILAKCLPVERPRSEEHTSELQSLTNLVC